MGKRLQMSYDNRIELTSKCGGKLVAFKHDNGTISVDVLDSWGKSGRVDIPTENMALLLQWLLKNNVGSKASKVIYGEKGKV